MRKQTAKNSKLQSFHSLQLYPKGKEAVKSLVQLNQGRQRESPCTIFQEAAYQCLYQGDLWGVLSKYQWPEIKQSFPVRPYKRNVTRAPRWSCSRPSLLSSLSGIQFQTGFRSTGQLNQMPSSVTQWCLTLCDPKDCSMPGFPVLHHLLEFAQIHVHWVGDTLQPSHPLSFPSPPALNLSYHQGLFQWVSSSHQVVKYCSFIISPFNEYSGLISFRIDWYYLLAVQGTLKSLLYHHS